MIYAIEYKSGSKKVCVSKKIENGHILIIEVVSKSRGVLQFKNAMGLSEDKYQKEFLPQYRKNNPSSRGSDSSNTSLHNGTVFNNSIPETRKSVKQNLSESDTEQKQKQLDIINETNPAPNTYSTWIRSVDDIKTLAETLEDDDWEDEVINPDLTRTDIQSAIERGEITVYSSYPIKNGFFCFSVKNGSGKLQRRRKNI